MGIELAPYIQDLDALRAKLARAACDGSAMGQLWLSVKNRAQQAPDAFPWFVPFVALVTGEPDDVRAACKALGTIGDAASLPVLEQAVGDQEWCTRTEAARSLAAIASAKPTGTAVCIQ